jgi:hypothetical protein
MGNRHSAAGMAEEIETTVVTVWSRAAVAAAGRNATGGSRRMAAKVTRAQGKSSPRKGTMSRFTGSASSVTR